MQILKKGFDLEFCNFAPEILRNVSLFIRGKIPRNKQNGLFFTHDKRVELNAGERSKHKFRIIMLDEPVKASE